MPRSRPVSTVEGEALTKHLDQSQGDLGEDFKAKGAIGVDEIGENRHRVPNQVQFVGEGVGPLDKFVFVFKPSIEALQVWTLPKYVRLFAYGDALGKAVLDEDGGPDQSEHYPASAGGPP